MPSKERPFIAPGQPLYPGVVPPSQHKPNTHGNRRWPDLYEMDVGSEVTYPEEHVIGARNTARRVTYKYDHRFDWRINDDGSITITRVA